MANTIYTYARTALGSADVDLLVDTIKCVLCSSSYTHSLAHQYLSSVGAGSRIATGTLSGKALNGGVFTASNLTYSAVAAGSTGTQLVIYQDTGVEATSILIAHINLADGLPVATDGGDITISWDTVSGLGIFYI
jgi:hypothetical protein